jgi:streptomycin 6-kinase
VNHARQQLSRIQPSVIARLDNFAPASNPDAREWIVHLPSSVGSLCDKWELSLDENRIFHGYNALVLLVRRHEEPLALKLTWPPAGMTDEAQALTAWDGQGMVQMVAVDEDAGAMLLERLNPDRTLMSLPPFEAAGVAGRLLRRLTIPAPPGFRSIRTLIGASGRTLVERHERLGHPMPAAWVHQAVEIAQYLQDHADTASLIHTDLHYDNILAGAREPWLAIDPRAAAAEPEAAVPELMWTRDDYMESDDSICRMLAATADAGELDLARARQWVIVRCVDYLLWGLEHGLTHDPERCRRVLEAVW